MLKPALPHIHALCDGMYWLTTDPQIFTTLMHWWMLWVHCKGKYHHIQTRKSPRCALQRVQSVVFRQNQTLSIELNLKETPQDQDACNLTFLQTRLRQNCSITLWFKRSSSLFFLKGQSETWPPQAINLLFYHSSTSPILDLLQLSYYIIFEAEVAQLRSSGVELHVAAIATWRAPLAAASRGVFETVRVHPLQTAHHTASPV